MDRLSGGTDGQETVAHGANARQVRAEAGTAGQNRLTRDIPDHQSALTDGDRLLPVPDKVVDGPIAGHIGRHGQRLKDANAIDPIMRDRRRFLEGESAGRRGHDPNGCAVEKTVAVKPGAGFL